MQELNVARRIAIPVDDGPEPAGPSAARPPMDPRTRVLLEAPILPTLLRLALPNILVMVVQAAVGIAETYFVGLLGTDALAGASLVFPALMLMQMMSAGAIGGGISSAIARALGSGRRADADALVIHALIIAIGLGLAFTLAMLAGGRWLYGTMGGREASLDAALTYSHIVFAGIVFVWIFNALANVLRATGNTVTPAVVSCVGAAIVVPLSPLLIFGWGSIPRFGIAGGAIATGVYFAAGSGVLWAYIWSGRSVVRPSFPVRLRWALFKDILRIGGIAAVTTVQTNVTVAITIGLIGTFGAAAIAGYGAGSRLEYLMVPLVFGLGNPLVAMVGTSIGAGRYERALCTAWIGAAIAAALTGTIGLAAAIFPLAWLSLFSTDPAMLDAGARYLRIVGPAYGLFGLGMALYFASQGAGRLWWPMLAGFARMAIAALGGWAALRFTGNMSHIFVALAVGLVAMGLINAAAVTLGTWRRRPQEL